MLVDPEKLNGYGLPLTKVVDAIRNNNTIEPAGMVQENYHLYLVTVTGLMREKEQIENTVVDVVQGHAGAGQGPGARWSRASSRVYNIVTANGRPAVLVNVLQQPDGNAVQIADAVNAELARHPQDACRRTSSSRRSTTSRSWCATRSRSVTESILIGLALVGRGARGFPEELAHHPGGGARDPASPS